MLKNVVEKNTFMLTVHLSLMSTDQRCRTHVRFEESLNNLLKFSFNNELFNNATILKIIIIANNLVSHCRNTYQIPYHRQHDRWRQHVFWIASIINIRFLLTVSVFTKYRIYTVYIYIYMSKFWSVFCFVLSV